MSQNYQINGIFLAIVTTLTLLIILGLAVAALIGTWQLISWLWSITVIGG